MHIELTNCYKGYYNKNKKEIVNLLSRKVCPLKIQTKKHYILSNQHFRTLHLNVKNKTKKHLHISLNRIQNFENNMFC